MSHTLRAMKSSSLNKVPESPLPAPGYKRLPQGRAAAARICLRPAPSVAGYSERRVHGGIMDLEVVEKEVASWTPEEQDHLAAFLTVLRLRRAPGRERGLPGRDPRAGATAAPPPSPYPPPAGSSHTYPTSHSSPPARPAPTPGRGSRGLPAAGRPAAPGRRCL